MREKSVVVAACTPATRGDATDSPATCAIGQKGADVYRRGDIHVISRQPLVDVGAYFVAVAADGGPQMYAELVSRQAETREPIERAIENPGGRAAPARVQKRGDTRGMRDEHRNTIGNRDSQRDAALPRDVTVSRITAEPSFPAVRVLEDPVAVNL